MFNPGIFPGEFWKTVSLMCGSSSFYRSHFRSNITRWRRKSLAQSFILRIDIVESLIWFPTIIHLSYGKNIPGFSSCCPCAEKSQCCLSVLTSNCAAPEHARAWIFKWVARQEGIVLTIILRARWNFRSMWEREEEYFTLSRGSYVRNSFEGTVVIKHCLNSH